MTPVRLFLRLLAEVPRSRLVALLTLMVFVGLTEGISLLLLAPLLEMLQAQSGAGTPLADGLATILRACGLTPSAEAILATFLLLVVLRSTALYAREYLATSVQYRLVDQLRYRCFKSVLQADWRWITTKRQADHANLLLTEISRVGVGLNFGIGLLATLTTILAYLAAAFTLSWSITLLALGSGLVVLLALSGQRRRAFELGLRLGEANRAMQGNVQESLSGIKLAKILGNENRHLEFFHKTTALLRQQQLRFSSQTSLSRSLFHIVGALLLTTYLYIGLNLWHTPVAELLTLVVVFGRLIPILMTAQQSFHHWLHALPSLIETDKLLEECRRAAEPNLPAKAAAWPVARAIHLENVSVRYADRKQAALDSISLTFPARTTTAIIGASGAGKSTLADVLMGLIDPDAGSLKVDDLTIDNENRIRWRRNVAYVPQDTFLFNDTIRNNLRWGYPEATEADLALALGHAAADFVFGLAEGIDTLVGDGGLRLSGGERQRIALARALLKHPSLLILDEATSALDMDNEAKVREAIEHLHGGLTVVIIGHRLATLEHADQVIVLDAGRVASQGSWATVRTCTSLIP
ncbi:MAG: Xenobiotic-transporting ATPase [Proteobacteria bacterium]|nr:Xenobiotic-transporting ATPase [Pseudomonadota bacterium]